jgi:hypothetical protein
VCDANAAHVEEERQCLEPFQVGRQFVGAPLKCAQRRLMLADVLFGVWPKEAAVRVRGEAQRRFSSASLAASFSEGAIQIV